MIRYGRDKRFTRTAFTLGVVVALATTGRPAAETVREMESDRGTVRITILPLAEPVAPAPTGSPSPDPAAQPIHEAPQPGEDTLHPVEAITDFTSLSEMARGSEAMLQVSYYDKASREELRFPLKYSELRRYLRKHPLDYRDGTLDERNVALMGDLAAALRIRMRDPAGGGEKP